MVLGSGCSQGASRPTDWSLDIPELDKVPPYTPPPAPSSGPVTRILQLSDLHIQANYSIGQCDLHSTHVISFFPQVPQLSVTTPCAAQLI